MGTGVLFGVSSVAFGLALVWLFYAPCPSIIPSTQFVSDTIGVHSSEVSDSETVGPFKDLGVL